MSFEGQMFCALIQMVQISQSTVEITKLEYSASA